MKWPVIPTNLEGLTAAEIRTLATAIARALAAAPTKLSEDEQAEWESYRKLGIDLNGRAAMLAEVEANDAAEAARVQADADAVAAQEAANAAAAATAAQDAANDPDVGKTQEEVEPEPELASVGASTIQTSLSVNTTREIVAPGFNTWRSSGAVPGRGQNVAIEGNRDLAEAIIEAARAMTAGASSRVDVATMSANFGGRTDYRLSDDAYANLGRFDRMRESNDELEAAFCAPETPLYNLSCESTDRRPVKASLPVFQTPERGAFSVFPSPTLSSITGGIGQWTSANDADVNAIKAACQTITCGTPTSYEIYAVYACLTVKNLMNMTFPELVAAYLNRLQAMRARRAEVLLLEAMANSADQIDAAPQGFGANVSLKRTILTYLGLYNELERWDSGDMEAWMPRWLLTALKVDAVSRRTTDGSYPMVPSTEQINASFRDIGLNPHWYMDRPSWATPIPTLATSGDLNFFPSSVEVLVAKRGKFALLDRGDLTIGVSPNNIYRIGDDLRKNQFTFFFESFEGLIDTDSCPAHLIQIPGLCYNGAQIADVAIACEGYDVEGIGS